jgi:hypothetical protein
MNEKIERISFLTERGRCDGTRERMSGNAD